MCSRSASSQDVQSVSTVKALEVCDKLPPSHHTCIHTGRAAPQTQTLTLHIAANGHADGHAQSHHRDRSQSAMRIARFGL